MDRCDSWGGKRTFASNLIFLCEGLPELTVGAEICEDLWVPLPPSVNLAQGGAHIIVNLSASDEMVGKDSYRRDLVKGSLPDWCAAIFTPQPERVNPPRIWYLAGRT